jgi:hypothetical protein
MALVWSTVSAAKRDRCGGISELDRRENDVRRDHGSTGARPAMETAQSRLRASAVVAVVDPTLTLVNPATPVRRHPISIGSHTNEVRRLKPSRRAFLSDII